MTHDPPAPDIPDIPDDPDDPDAPDDPEPETPAAPGVSPSPAEQIRTLGFDPDQVQAVVLTPTSLVAISVDYPEPYTPPEPQQETP